jgi:uncharacterized protein YkwD
MNRIRDTGYKACTAAENIAWGYRHPDQVVAGWTRSRDHRRNLLHREIREIGIATATGNGRQYWVMVLARNC